MRLLQRMLNDIKRGENIDLYLTVLAAVGIAILNVLGLAPADWIGPLTLAILALLAFTSLASRYQVERLYEKLSQPSSSLFLDKFSSTLDQDIELSKSLVLVGVSLDRMFERYYSVFERKAQRGDTIKMLLVHPDGAALEMAVSRALWETNKEVLRLKIKTSLETICRIKRVAPDNIAVRTIKNPLSYEAVLINHETPFSPGVIYLENYPYKSPKSFVPKHIFHEQDGKWYRFFESEILRLWENGIEWTSDTDTTADLS